LGGNFTGTLWGKGGVKTAEFRKKKEKGSEGNASSLRPHKKKKRKSQLKLSVKAVRGKWGGIEKKKEKKTKKKKQRQITKGKV